MRNIHSIPEEISVLEFDRGGGGKVLMAGASICGQSLQSTLNSPIPCSVSRGYISTMPLSFSKYNAAQRVWRKARRETKDFTTHTHTDTNAPHPFTVQLPMATYGPINSPIERLSTFSNIHANFMLLLLLRFVFIAAATFPWTRTRVLCAFFFFAREREY